MIGVPLGLITANVAEWWVHKHVLHGRGRDPRSFWHFHLDEHHAAALRNEGRDPAYTRSPWRWNAQGKELFGLVLLTAPVLPLFPVAPFFVGTLVYSSANYYRKHKRAHLDPDWAREHLSWHWDHHMGPNQDANWGVTRPWIDRLVGTREVYKGTAREAADRARRAALDATRRSA